MKIRQFVPPVRFALSHLKISLPEIVLVNLNSLFLFELAKIVQSWKKFIYNNTG